MWLSHCSSRLNCGFKWPEKARGRFIIADQQRRFVFVGQQRRFNIASQHRERRDICRLDFKDIKLLCLNL